MISLQVLTWTLSFSLVATAIPRTAVAAPAPEIPTSNKCNDWSKSETFEEASRDYMKLAESADQDFGCMTRASWMATEDLFRDENGSLYIARLKNFDTQYREQSFARPQLAKAFEDFRKSEQALFAGLHCSTTRSHGSTGSLFDGCTNY